MGGEEGGGAKGKGTSKEWNKQQAKATQALKAEYFDIYMEIFELALQCRLLLARPRFLCEGSASSSSLSLSPSSLPPPDPGAIDKQQTIALTEEKVLRTGAAYSPC